MTVHIPIVLQIDLAVRKRPVVRNLAVVRKLPVVHTQVELLSGDSLPHLVSVVSFLMEIKFSELKQSNNAIYKQRVMCQVYFSSV